MKFFFFIFFILTSAPALSAADPDTGLQGHILGIPGDTVTVDMDIFRELRPGELGVLKRNGARIASVEVVRSDRNNVFLRALDGVRGFAPRAGDIAYFTAAGPGTRKPAAAGAGLGGEDLVPLLTPLPAVIPEKKKPPYRVSARTHGRALVRQFYQDASPGNFNQRTTRLDTDGALEHIGAGPWSFAWSGSGSYLEGNRPSVPDDFRRFRPRARRLTLSRPLGEGGFLRAGRFFARELPGLGTVDGLAAETRSGWLGLGAVAGTRPERRFQEFSSHELLGSLYASAETGTPGQGSYAATLGVLHTRWLGKPDELAALFDQNFDFGPPLSVYQTAQLDFNGGAARTHKGARLTRLDVSLNSSVNPRLTLRGGLNHFEPVDTAAERAFTGGDAPFAINGGYWRYWAGSGQTLPWDLGLDEEISWTEAGGIEESEQPGLWRATLWRQGLPWLPDGRTYVTGYNLPGLDGTDYGGSTGLTLPMSDGKFVADADAGFHYARGAGGGRNLKLGDAGLRLDWRPNRTWQLEAAATKVWRGSARSSSASGGVTFRW